MTRKTAALTFSPALALLVVGAVWWWPRGPQEDLETDPGEDPQAEQAATPEVAMAAFDLYFPGRDGRLHAERHEVPRHEEPAAQIAALLEQLLAGPQDQALVAPLGAGVSVRAVYLVGDGRVVVDLAAAEDAAPLAAGSSQERAMVYSLVDTVLLNTPDAGSLVLLWNGQQPVTFAGHLDTSRPLYADRTLIATR